MHNHERIHPSRFDTTGLAKYGNRHTSTILRTAKNCGHRVSVEHGSSKPYPRLFVVFDDEQHPNNESEWRWGKYWWKCNAAGWRIPFEFNDNG